MKRQHDNFQCNLYYRRGISKNKNPKYDIANLDRIHIRHFVKKNQHAIIKMIMVGKCIRPFAHFRF